MTVKPKRFWRILGCVLIGLAALLALAITFTIGWRPFIGPRARSLTSRRFEATPARLERGKYLVNNVTGCFGCHSDRDWKLPGAPSLEGRIGAGHNWADEDFPWLTAPNITPDPETGVGAWSDDTLARAIREGIGHDDRALFPIMPYPNFRHMSDEDLASIITYIRTVPPVRNELPKTQIPFPLRLLIKSEPQPVEGEVPIPDQSDPVKNGAYLVTMASCADCHTPQKEGAAIPGLEFAGGFLLRGPSGAAVSANLTPDASGISYYDETLFIDAMRTGHVKVRELNNAMPWVFYRGMTDDDLKAIFAWLRTLKPVKHSIDNSEPPTQCKLCGEKHGLGDRN